MWSWLVVLSLTLVVVLPAYSKPVVFWQEGFPTVDSQSVSRQALNEALSAMGPSFADIEELKQGEVLKDADLLVLPYGSAFPAEAWKAILDYLGQGGSILNLGGRPLFVPVFREQAGFVAAAPQNTYCRSLGIWHSYEVPQEDRASFIWDNAYPAFTAKELRVEKVYVTGFWWDQPEVRGMGFFLDARGERMAAPVVEADFISLHSQQQSAFRGTRCVFLNFKPVAGYWESPSGLNLIREAAIHATEGSSLLRVELQNSALAQGESPLVTVHFRNVRRQRRGLPQTGSIRLELSSDGQVLSSARVDCAGDSVATNIVLPNPSKPGFYQVRASYELGGKAKKVYENGFWVRDEQLLRSGSRLEPADPYFKMEGKPFIPFGTNYFSTDGYYNGFRGGNALVWERDFAEMEKNGISFVRTGIWSNQADILNALSGGADERFLRGLEAFLHSAARHHIQVNFTFYAFDPHTIRRYPGETSLQVGPGTNPYTDPVAIRAQKNYLLSIVSRFKGVSFLSWDLINEPSFSNPRRLWKGNTPNADPTELNAWNQWLEKRYQTLQKLASAWLTTPEELKAFGEIPLPALEELDLKRYDNPNQVRAIDYNLFAQDMFRHWTAEMVSAIRSTGSRQLVDVGQDEGGVSDRVLNQFYGDAGVGFTTNHTWWRDDALLWDSVAAKRPGVPNLVGETGVQPVWRMDASWRWDELNAAGLLERKLALGLAAANGGSLQWDWAHGDTFGIKRGDGSNKIWQDVLRGLAEFAQKAGPHLSQLNPPEVAIVLPQSLQLSVFNSHALDAQQKCVRALFHGARSSAYVVGEYQMELLGTPKLMILPSPWILSQQAWQAILERVRMGATLLTSGRLDLDEHFQTVSRAKEAGLDFQWKVLDTRENLVEWPGGRAWLTYGEDKCTYLERAQLPSNQSFVEWSVGRGKILFFSFPIEFNDNLTAISEIYCMALARAGVVPVYSTSIEDPGILICPTQMQSATLYALTSESSSARRVTWKDMLSGKDMAIHLDPGRAALVLVSQKGEVLAAYGKVSSANH
jgi:hypothetical protein